MDNETEARVKCCKVWVAEEERHKTGSALHDNEGDPAAPWSRGSLDLRRLPNGQLVAILIDSWSKFPVIKMLRSTSKDITTALEKVFALVGKISETNPHCKDRH